MKKNINIIKLLEESIEENESQLNGGKVFSEFKKEDFNFIFDYVELNGNDLNVVEFVSFCICKFWDIISTIKYKEEFWGRKFIEFNFLELLLSKAENILFSYNLLIKSKQYEQAFSIFRNYIEISSIIFACSLDKDFFEKYTSNIETEQEDIEMWFKYLKPSKVSNFLKSRKGKDINQIENYSIDRFTGEQRATLYKFTSEISHAKFKSLKNNKDFNEMMVLSTDFLVNSTLLIHIINYEKLQYNSDKDERKLQIIVNLWIKLLYGHILK